MPELLDISGLGQGERYPAKRVSYETVPGAGGSPFRTLMPVNLGEMPMHQKRMEITPKMALKYARLYFKRGKYMGANAWARRALQAHEPGIRKQAAAIIAKTDEYGLRGLI